MNFFKKKTENIEIKNIVRKDTAEIDLDMERVESVERRLKMDDVDALVVNGSLGVLENILVRNSDAFKSGSKKELLEKIENAIEIASEDLKSEKVLSKVSDATSIKTANDELKKVKDIIFEIKNNMVKK